MTKNPRKAWRTDLKWLFGILAAVLLTVSLTSLALYRVATNPDVEKFQKAYSKQSPDKAGGLFGMQANPIDPKGMSNIKLKIGGKSYTMGQLQKMPQADMEKLMTQMDPKELENLTKMMTPGMGSTTPGKGKAKGHPPGVNGPPDMQVFGGQMGQMILQSVLGPIISSVTEAIKGMAMTLTLVALPLSLLFLILMIVFSYRWGRLTSFSIILLLASAPVFSIAAMLKMMSSFNAPNKGPDIFSLIASIANANFVLFLTLIVVGCFLLVVSLGGSIISGLMSRPPKKPLKPVKQQPLAKAS